MTINEMSQEFDILYNQINSNQASSLDEYEKSIFLTRAQDELVKAYFDPRANKLVRGFDDGQKRQYDFSELIVNSTLYDIDLTDSDNSSLNQYDPRSFMYEFPSDIFLTLNESVYERVYTNQVQVSDREYEDYIYQIIPITYEEYAVLMQKPYQYPPKRQVWRLITNQHVSAHDDNANNTNGTSACAEIIGRFLNNYPYQTGGTNHTSPQYRIRYVKKPTPIILVDLDTNYNGLTIDGYHGNPDVDGSVAIYEPIGRGIGIPCYLPDGVHHEIVQRAVELASAVYNPQAVNMITGIGGASQTDIGMTGAGRPEGQRRQQQ